MIGTELLDDPRSDPVLVGRELRDIARLNALFGGTRAVVRELKSFFERRRAMGIRKRETWTLLDVGTGSGDIALAARTAARQLDIDLKAIGLLEKEGDNNNHAAVSRLYHKGNDPLEVMKWKEFYDRIETAIDGCEDVGNTLERIVLKNG